MSLRSGLLALAFVCAGALAFIFFALSTVVLLADRDSGAAFSGADGARPATASDERDQVASRRQSAAPSKSGGPAVALIVKDRLYFLKTILGE